jgi:hypothetical protein
MGCAKGVLEAGSRASDYFSAALLSVGIGELNSRPRGGGRVLGRTRSRDKGRTWRVYGELTHPRTWLIENTVVERTDGSVLMIFRTTTGVLYQVPLMRADWPFGTPRDVGVSRPTRDNDFNGGFDREPVLNADGKPPGGRACASFGLSHRKR